MPQLVTDPDLLRQLEATDAAPAAPPPAAPPPDDSAGPGITGMPALSHPSQARLLPPGTKFLIPDGRIGTVPQPDTSPLGQAKAAIDAGAPHAAVVDRLREQGHDVSPGDLGMKEVTDPALLQQLDAPDQQTPGVRFAAPSDERNVPTAKDDPVYHGAVPVGQAPDMGGTTAFASGVQGAPVVGPAISSGIQAAAAGARSLAGGGSYADERRNVQEMTDLARQQHPTAATAGDVTGAVAATAPMIAAAPEVFGAGAGDLTLGKMVAGGLSGGALGGTDAAVRSGGDLSAIKGGALAGGVGGAAGPPLAAIASAAGQGLASGVARLAERGTGLTRPVAQTLMRAAETDGALGPEGLARIREAGPNGMLADIGPAASGVLDTTLQRGGPGATAARRAIEARPLAPITT